MTGHLRVRSRAQSAFGSSGVGAAGLLLSVFALQVVGCSKEKAPREPVPGGREATLTSKAEDRAPAPAVRAPGMPPDTSLAPPADPAIAVERLFSNIDENSVENRMLREVEEKSFLRHPEAVSVLKQAYAETDDVQKRWKAVDLASRVRSGEAVPFLEDVASGARIAPDVAGDIASDESHEEADHDARVRLRAGAGLAEAVAAGVNGSADAVQHVLTSADPSVAQVTAAELSAKGLLTSELTGVLRARGLSPPFKTLSEAEREVAGAG